MLDVGLTAKRTNNILARADAAQNATCIIAEEKWFSMIVDADLIGIFFAS